MLIKFKPHDYQQEAIQHIKQHTHCALLLDMGLGKTISCLTAIDALMYDEFTVTKTLVVAPKNVAAHTWPSEVRKWEHTKHLRVVAVTGTPKQRLAKLNQDADIYTIGRDSVVWLVEHWSQIKTKFDVLVLDELSSFKSQSSKRFKALRKIRGTFKRVIGLTGTPTPNGLADLWSQFYLIDGGHRLGKTVTVYRQNYFVPGMRNGAQIYNWRIRGEEAANEIYDLISDISLSMKAKDYLTDLPPRTDNILPVELTAKQMEQYKTLEREMVLELDHADIIADNAAAVTGKLLQLANGGIYDEDKNFTHIHDLKLDELTRIVDDSQGQPILVFYSFISDLERLKAKFPQAEEIKDTNTLDRWNKGEIPMLLAHPASAGHGLNLQQGGHIIVWFGLTWSLELYQQANARLHRQGQQHPVIVHHLLAKDTVDEQVLKVLQGKDVTQEALLQAVKERLRALD